MRQTEFNPNEPPKERDPHPRPFPLNGRGEKAPKLDVFGGKAAENIQFRPHSFGRLHV